MNKSQNKSIMSPIREFNSEGRKKYFEIISRCRESSEVLDNERLDLKKSITKDISPNQNKLLKNKEYKIFWDNYVEKKQKLKSGLLNDIRSLFVEKNYTKTKSKNEIDSSKIFQDRYDMCIYLEKSLDQIGSMRERWGVLEWVSAFYSEQLLRDINESSPIITTDWHICMQNDIEPYDDSQTFGSKNNNVLKRHMLHHHYLYFKKYRGHQDESEVIRYLKQEKEKPWQRLANNFGDYFEQCYAGKRERLTINLIKYINRKKCTKKGGDAYTQLWKYQEFIKEDYHADMMKYESFEEKMDQIRAEVKSNN